MMLLQSGCNGVLCLALFQAKHSVVWCVRNEEHLTLHCH
jgi:hypothetical protein